MQYIEEYVHVYDQSSWKVAGMHGGLRVLASKISKGQRTTTNLVFCNSKDQQFSCKDNKEKKDFENSDLWQEEMFLVPLYKCISRNYSFL